MSRIIDTAVFGGCNELWFDRRVKDLDWEVMPWSTDLRDMGNKKTRNQAEIEYREARKAAFDAVSEEFLQATGLTVKLRDITEEALQFAEQWRASYPEERMFHQPGWDWRKQAHRFRRRPRRVEMAIWHNDQLCGLALGRISDKRIIITIHLLEANPGNTALQGKVAPLATRTIEVLSATLGCYMVSIENPVDELIEYYESLGYTNRVTKGKKVIRLIKRLNELM